MTHTYGCGKSKSKKCRCSCGGVLHGSMREDQGPMADRPLNEFIGGDAGAWIARMRGMSFRCICGCKFKLTRFFGYPHDNGLMDAKSKRWWIWTECPGCDHQWSFAHTERTLINSN